MYRHAQALLWASCRYSVIWYFTYYNLRFRAFCFTDRQKMNGHTWQSRKHGCKRDCMTTSIAWPRADSAASSFFFSFSHAHPIGAVGWQNSCFEHPLLFFFSFSLLARSVGKIHMWVMFVACRSQLRYKNTKNLKIFIQPVWYSGQHNGFPWWRSWVRILLLLILFSITKT